MSNPSNIKQTTNIHHRRKELGRLMMPTEIEKLIEAHRHYVETVVKNETPEESKQALIRTGVIDEKGDIILRHQEEW